MLLQMYSYKQTEENYTSEWFQYIDMQRFLHLVGLKKSCFQMPYTNIMYNEQHV